MSTVEHKLELSQFEKNTLFPELTKIFINLFSNEKNVLTEWIPGQIGKQTA